MSYVLHHFKICCPQLAEEMIGYREITSMDLLVTLEDGSKVLFDDFTKTYRLLPDESVRDTKEAYKKEYSYKLRSRMDRRCVSQAQLSEATGISQSTISKYVRGYEVPSLFNANKIAKALGCSVDDFRYY